MFNRRNWFPVTVFIMAASASILFISPTASETVAIETQTMKQAGPDIRIRIKTTSDWTAVKLISGAILNETEILSSSSEASTASFDIDRFLLIQPLSRAEAGNSAEMVADLFFTKDPMSENLEFEIDRGHIGATTVEISSYACRQPIIIETFIWEGTRPSGENVQSFKIPKAQLSVFPPNEYTVIAQLNFWYYGPGIYGGFENILGERITPLTPLLGETYRADDPDVVFQQIEWAAEYGVDAFSIEWTTPRGVGCCGSMEDTLDDVFLKSPNINKVRWTIFYDFVLRLAQTPGLEQGVGSFDFDNPEVYGTLVSDFKHFATKYFGHPQYLSIDGRPVIYIWATNQFVGNLEGALREARKQVAKLGYDVFIVGDEVTAGNFDPYHASLFDGNTTFTFLIGGNDFTWWKSVGDAIENVDQIFEKWRANIKDLKVIDREELVNFQSAWAPQYDERLFVGDDGIYVPATSKEQVLKMAEIARKHAEPVGSQKQKLIWLNTWNNWAETTTIEPTVNLGPKYPAGNYQFDMLEVVRDVFGSVTPSCGTPPSDSDGDGYTKNQGDCNDSDDSINPSVSEICGDGIDQDCDGIDLVCQSSIDGGYNVTSGLDIKAVLQVSGTPVTLVWKMVGADINPVGDQVISGYFYADPNDFAYGSQYNPELFVKVYIASNGWCNIAFNHVTVDAVSVYSMNNGEMQSSSATLGQRLVEHQYNGVGIDDTLQVAGEAPVASSADGYALSSGLWAKAILQPTTGPVNLIWKEVGADITASGDKVVSGYFYAAPNDFAFGSVYNPEVFVKVYIAANGWANIAFNHVTVDGVDSSSAHNYNGLTGQSGSATLNNRLVEHQYDSVVLQ